MAGSWKENLANVSALLESREYRHGVKAVSASAIGAQFFCEMKVDQGFVHGEVETEEKAEGDRLHGELLAMEPASRESLLDDIEKRKLLVASFPLAAEADGLVIIGVPDAVVFQDARPTHVIELKTTRGSTSILYDGQRAQTTVYGLLLDSVGFDCRNLELVVVKLHRDAPLPEKQRVDFLDALTESLVKKKSIPWAGSGREGQVAIHSFPYQRGEAIEVLKQTRGYWLDQRKPSPTSNPNKCRACEFSAVCPSSLAR